MKIDLAERKILGYLKLSREGMPQDIRIAPDGKVFYVADMMSDGVFVIDADTFTEIAFIPTGVGAHGLYPSRDGKKLYVSNRGTHGASRPHGEGSIAVIDFATRAVETRWPIPGGGSPDMGNISADGKTLWLAGRFDGVVYAIDTTSGTSPASRWGGTAWAHRLAAARPLFARPYRQHALAAGPPPARGAMPRRGERDRCREPDMTCLPSLALPT